MNNINSLYCTEIYESGFPAKMTDGLFRIGGLSLTKRFADACAFNEGSIVIDIGCGNGMTVEYLRDQYRLQTAGIDLSAVLLGQGKERLQNLNLIQAESELLPFAAETADGVISECSLSVMQYSDRTLAEINRILIPKGKLCISDVYIRNQEGAAALRRIKCSGCISGALTFNELKQKLRDNGFIILKMEDQSVLLKDFTARLIMDCGSIKPYWNLISCTEENRLFIWDTIIKARIGYYWLIAEKNSMGVCHE
ncbi:MAG: class I SAM-dependent methyltransferase [Spirochaetota bacterium]